MYTINFFNIYICGNYVFYWEVREFLMDTTYMLIKERLIKKVLDYV